jgi:uncharacterized membrane protein
MRTPGPARKSRRRSFAKAVSWRIAGSLDTLALSLILSGNIRLAGLIAGAEAVTKTILYGLHERAWTAVHWGQSA